MKSVNKYTMILIVGGLLMVGILHHPSSVQTLVNIQSKNDEKSLKKDSQNSYSETKIVDKKRESSKFVFNEDPSKVEMPITEDFLISFD